MSTDSKKLDNLKGFPDRLEHWRTEEVGCSQRELRETVNEHLPPGHQRRSDQSISNWEVPWTDETGAWKESPHAGPPSAFLVGLKRAFPEVNLGWLLFGHGEPRVSDEAAHQFLQQVADELPDPDPEARIPSLFLRRHLPRPAKEALLSFFREVYESNVQHFAETSGPAFVDVEGTREDPVSWDAFRRLGARRIDEVRNRVCELLEEPLRGDETGAWASVEELSDAELTSYVQGQLAAWRPLLRSMRGNAPEVGS